MSSSKHGWTGRKKIRFFTNSHKCIISCNTSWASPCISCCQIAPHQAMKASMHRSLELFEGVHWNLLSISNHKNSQLFNDHEKAKDQLTICWMRPTKLPDHLIYHSMFSVTPCTGWIPYLHVVLISPSLSLWVASRCKRYLCQISIKLRLQICQFLKLCYQSLEAGKQ